MMQVYKQYAELLVTVVVPWMLLCILNIRIYWAVRTNRCPISGGDVNDNQVLCRRGLARESLVRRGEGARPGRRGESSSSAETSLAVTLLTLVLVHLSCHAPKFWLSFYKVTAHSTGSK